MDGWSSRGRIVGNGADRDGERDREADARISERTREGQSVRNGLVGEVRRAATRQRQSALMRFAAIGQNC
jgi:hypothetical protein